MENTDFSKIEKKLTNEVKSESHGHYIFPLSSDCSSWIGINMSNIKTIFNPESFEIWGVLKKYLSHARKTNEEVL